MNAAPPPAPSTGMLRRPLLAGLQVAAVLWLGDTLLSGWLYLRLYGEHLGTASAISGAVVDAASLAGLWLAGLAVVLRFPLSGTHATRNALLLGAVALAIVPLRIVLLWLILPAGWLTDPDWPRLLLFYYPNNLELFLFGVAAAHLIVFQWQVADTEQQRLETSRRVQQARLAALHTELQPHFLFNSLHAVSALLYLDPARADRVLAQLGGLLSLADRHAEAESVPLAVEVDFARRFLELQQLRLSRPLHVEWHVDPDAEDIHVPYLVLQPLLENAIKYGIPGGGGGYTLRIEVQRSTEGWTLAVEDNGPGPALRWREGIGLSNTRLRVQTLYGEQSSVTLGPGRLSGARVEIVLPDTLAGAGSANRPERAP